MQVYQLNNLVPATVIKRPSALIKTPYVSDIQLTDDIEPHLGHSLSLGCCGLCDTGAQIYITQILNYKPGLHCDYTVQLSRTRDNILVGINPRIAEHIVENCLKLREPINNIATYKREYTVNKELLGTEKAVRFDFGGTLENGAPFYLEVKNVPLATNKTAYFPQGPQSRRASSADGFRIKPTERTEGSTARETKVSLDTVSPRALKHIQELMHIKVNNPLARCIICYVIQRGDVDHFEISKKDPEYRDAVFKAIDAGVEALAIVVNWSLSRNARSGNFVSLSGIECSTARGTATFVKVLPVS